MIIDSRKIYHYFGLVLLLSGIGLRLMYYFQNRSFFIDEAALASEIAQGNFLDFFAPLTYQFSPPLFSIFTKLSTVVFGNTENAFRLVPLLAGIAALVLFYQYLNHKFSKEVSWLGVAFLAIFLPMVRYSTEAKQYSVDVFFTILLLYLVDVKWTKEDPRFYFKWAIVGGLAVWFSMPAVFILSGVGLYNLYGFYREKDWVAFRKYSLVIGFWLLNFGMYFWLILVNDIGRESLADFHSNHFLPFPPTSIADLKSFGNLLLAPINEGLGGTFLAHLFAVGFAFSGVLNLWKKDKKLLLLFLIPLLFTYLASSIGLYSLIGRMVLFMVPIVLILISHGLQLLVEKGNQRGIQKGRGKIIHVVTLVGIVILANSKTLTLESFEVEAGREVMAYVAERRQADELVYVQDLGIQTFNYYSQYADNFDGAFKANFGNAVHLKWDDKLAPVAAHSKVWLITIHDNDKILKQVDAAFGNSHLQKDGIYLEQASARLFYKK